MAAGGDWAHAAALVESQARGGWAQEGPAHPATAWEWGGSRLDAWAADSPPTVPAQQAAAAASSEGQLGWPEDSASSYAGASAGQGSGAPAGKLAELAASPPADPGWLPPQFTGRPEAAQEEIDELLGLLGLK